MLERIRLGDFTGTVLAKQLGFAQAHVSNFLNGKRLLSLEGLDRVLAAKDLSIEELLSGHAVAGHSPLNRLSASERQLGSYPPTGSKSPVEPGDCVIEVPVVSPSSVVEEPDIRFSSIIETILLSSNHLLINRSHPTPKRAHWQRFVATRPDGQQIAAMRPLLAMGCIVVIDRHSNSFAYDGAAKKADPPTLYAIRYGSSLLLRAVEFDGGHLILRASSMGCPTQLIPVTATQTIADYLIGRICTILSAV